MSLLAYVVLAIVALMLLYIHTYMYGGIRWLINVVKTLPRDIRTSIVLVMAYLHLKKMSIMKQTIGQLFHQQMLQHPSKIAFIFEGREWTFREVEEASNRIANMAIDQGLCKGDVVAIFLESQPAVPILWLGLSKVGVIAALINHSLRGQSLTHCVRVSEAKAIIFDAKLQEALETADSNSLTKLKLFRFNDESNSETMSSSSSNVTTASRKLLESVINMQTVLELVASTPPAPHYSADQSPRDPLLYIYTSGTTGLPKAAVIRHERFFWMAYSTKVLFGVTNSDRIYCTLPLHHSAGGILGVGFCFLGGSTVVVRRRFSASKFWTECSYYRCTVVQYIGELCRYLLAQPLSSTDSEHNVRLAIGNGMRAGEVWRSFVSRFQVDRVCEFYGSTEGNANLANTMGKEGAVGFNSIFLPWVYPVRLVRFDVVSEEILRDASGLCISCQPGEVGELVGKISNNAMRTFDGYLGQESTSRKIVRNVLRRGDSYFRTGDLLIMDEQGFMFFKDRAGDTFRWHGENVATTEVESVIASALDSAVCGNNSNITIESCPTGVIVYGVEVPGCEGRAGMATILVDQKSINLNHVAQCLTSELPPYARPLFIRLSRACEMTGTFKFKKVTLKEEGFNPNVVSDPLFYWDRKTSSFVALDEIAFSQISNHLIKI